MSHPLSPLFHPRHIAVIGASEQPDSFGEHIFSMLHSTGLQAKITPLNLHHRSIGGLPAFNSIGKLPEAADLAIITTPPSTYDSLFRACLKHDVRHLIVLQNWAALDDDTREDIKKSVAKAAKQGLFIAPCDPAGLNSPEYGLYANLYRHRPNAGDIALIAYGHTLPNLFKRWQLGISKQITLSETLQSLDAAQLIDYLREDSASRLLVVQYPSHNVNSHFFSALRQAALTHPLILHAPQCLSENQTAALQQWTEQHGLLFTRSPTQLNTAIRAVQSQLPPIGHLVLSGNSQAGWLAEATDTPPSARISEAYLPENIGTLPFYQHIQQLLDTPENDAVLALVEPSIYHNESEIQLHLSQLQQQHNKPLLTVSSFSDRHYLHFETPEAALAFCQALHQRQHVQQAVIRLPAENSRPQGLAKPEI